MQVHRSLAVPGVGLALMLSLLLGCAAPLVEGVGRGEIDLADWPEGTRRLEAGDPEGPKLAGVHVPAAAEAPIVLHLLPRAAAITVGLAPFGGFRETFGAFRDSGWSSVVFDYRGVGASEGEVTPLALPQDARAMWTRALELAGGDASRVILRGASLGTLAIAAILETGARPGAVILVAPVDAESVVGHAARDRHGAIIGGLGSAFSRGPEIPGLATTLRDLEVPALVILPHEDPLLPATEVEEMRQSASASVRFESRELDHQALVLRFYGFEMGEFSGRVVGVLDPSEAEFLRRL